MLTNITVVGAGSRTASSLIPMLLEETPATLHLLSSQTLPYTGERVRTHKLDVLDRAALKQVVMGTMSEVVVNLAAMTNVDKCETDRLLCWNANVTLVEQLARLCRIMDAQLVQLSTDYVFDGAKGLYSETDLPNPISYYGKSKLAAENVALGAGVHAAVVRTNVVYGPDDNHPDFVRWVIDALDSGTPVKIVSDQFSNPTYVDDVAEAILRIVRRRRAGMFHIAGTDWISRLEFAQRIAAMFKGNAELLIPITTEELKQPARRPLLGGLLTLKAEADLGMKMRGIESGLVSLRHAVFSKQNMPTIRN